jgi:uncharacterized membrane protein
MAGGRWSDERVEIVVGALLRAGVTIAALVVGAGGAVYLVRHGLEPVRYAAFRGEPEGLRSVSGIIRDLWPLQGRSMVQLGLLLLIATPVARVAFAAVAFALQRDRAYVVITLLVLGILLYSLAGGGPT